VLAGLAPFSKKIGPLFRSPASKAGPKNDCTKLFYVFTNLYFSSHNLSDVIATLSKGSNL
jgi:hypothetical protein